MEKTILTIIVFFANLDNALLSLCRAAFVGCVWEWHNKGDNPHQSLRFMLICLAHGDRHFDVESLLIFQKVKSCPRRGWRLFKE